MKFKKGDRVEYVGNPNGLGMDEDFMGEVYTIDHVEDGDTAFMDTGRMYYVRNLALLTYVPEGLFEL